MGTQVEMGIFDIGATLTKLFAQATSEDFRTNGAAQFLRATQSDDTQRALVERQNNTISSLDTPMLTKIAAARGAMFTNLCVSVAVAHAVGMSKGRVTIPYEYSLDPETTRAVLSDFVEWVGSLGVGVQITAMSRDGGQGVDGFQITWHDLPPGDAHNAMETI